MAQNRFSASVVSRSKRGNVIARAAYIARARLRDDRTAEFKDYRAKGGLEWEGIFTPKDAPEWAKDREHLWNEVEKQEDRSRHHARAQLARDFKISLPFELSEQQRLWLVKDFARELSRKGMVVDVAIHAPDRKNDERNYHVHMLVTMRELKSDGFGNKVREWNGKEVLEKWRERWSELGSRALDRAGFSLEAERFREGHQTLKVQREAALARGDTEWAEKLDREPQRHLGPSASAMERDGKRTVNGDINRDIEERNLERQLIRGLGRLKDNAMYRGGKVLNATDRILDKQIESPRTRTAKTADVVGNGMGKAMDVVADVFESILSGPKLTPEQQQQTQDALIQRQLDNEEARRRGRDRER